MKERLLDLLLLVVVDVKRLDVAVIAQTAQTARTGRERRHGRTLHETRRRTAHWIRGRHGGRARSAAARGNLVREGCV